VLTEQSKSSLAQTFRRVAQETLVRARDDIVDIASRDLAVDDGRAGEHLLVITLTSFVFRLLVIFQIADSAPNRAYYVKEGADRPLGESFAEVANMCVGALNRELSHDFPHLAMSTPYQLDGECLAHLGELHPQYSASYAISINGTAKLAVTLCICCYAPMVIAVHAQRAEQALGELELF